MRRWSGAGAIATLLLLAGFTALASLLGGGPARASSTPDQVFRTNPPPSTAPSTSPTSAPASTATPATVRPVVTTVAVATTRAHSTATTAHARVIAPTYTTPRSQYQAPTTPPTTTAPTTTTTILGIGGHLPAAPVTLPLHTQSSNGHVNPAFAWLSGAGFAVALLIVGYRFFATRPGGKDRAPVG